MNRRGFTLLEVLVALTLLLIGIVAVTNLMMLGVIHANLSAFRTTAGITASSQLALLRAGGVSNLENWKDKNIYHQATQKESESCLCSGWYSSVELVSSGGDELYRVTITVISLNGREETFVTYLANIGEAATSSSKVIEQPIKIYERD